MSAVYPKAREILVDWAFNASAPADLELRVVGVKSTYDYSNSHVQFSDLGAHVASDEIVLTGVTYENGVLDSDGFTLTTIPADTLLGGLVFYLYWAGGTRLVSHHSRLNGDILPILVIQGQQAFTVDPAGICQI